ncbi:MAG: glycosyltransferase family 4 protein [Acidimicrobiia bacterium]|nr:glycosyltransferase family 4 protein [Acidimicrobiia bacterium]
MRVAFDATPLLGNPTGIGWFTLELLRAVARRHEVDPLAFAMTWRGRKALDAAIPAGVRGVRRPMPARLVRALWGRTDIPRIEPWTGRVDVVHGTNFVVPPTAGSSVVTVHDLTAWRFPELTDQPTRALPKLVARAVRRGAWVHTPSQFVADEVRERISVEPDRVVAIHSGIPEVPDSRAGAGRELAGLAPGDRYMLALGTIEPRKNHVALVEAFDRLAPAHPDVHLVVVGPPGWGVTRFEQAVAHSHASERIHRLGYVSANERAALLRDAAVFAYPSVYEGFGFPPLEAMSVGVPVVATTAGSLPEVLGDAAILVDGSRDGLQAADPLAEALATLLDDDAEWEARSKAGRDHTAHFSWDTTADQMVRLYHAAMAR